MRTSGVGNAVPEADRISPKGSNQLRNNSEKPSHKRNEGGHLDADDPEEQLDHTFVEFVDTLVEPVDSLVELLHPLVEAHHHLVQAPQHALYPNQSGSDLLHLYLEQGQTFFNHRHLEPPHDTVVVTVS